MQAGAEQAGADTVALVLLDLFPGATVTTGEDVPGDIGEEAFRRIATPSVVRHTGGPAGVFAILIDDGLLVEPFLEERLRAADLPALVAEDPRGIIGFGDSGAMVLGEGNLP